MASTQYSPTPDVNPSEQVPDDIQRIQSSPTAFGGAIAQGAQELGQGAVKATDFFNSISSDQGLNNFDQEALEALRGTGKMGPDGQPDTGFFGTRGQATMDGYNSANTRLQDIFNRNKANLSPQAQLEYDRAGRRILNNYLNQAASHYDTQSHSWGTEVQTVTQKNSLNAISSNPENDIDFSHRTGDVFNSLIKTAQINGELPRDLTAAPLTSEQSAVVTNARNQAQQMTWTSRIETLGATKSDVAYQMALSHQAELGPKLGPELVRQMRNQASAVTGTAAGTEAVSQALQGNIQAPGGAAAALIRSREGFQPAAYWDVNHYRTGYGSDTVTKADGTFEPVTATTTVTRADAERDLQRRTRLSQDEVAVQIGEGRWQSLPEQAKAALTSMTYNYGHLPQDVAAAAAGGSPQDIARMIAGHSSDNGGVNAQRRMQEAALVSGGGGGGSGGAAAGFGPVAPSMTDVGGLPVEQAAFQPSPGAPPITPAAGVEAPSAPPQQDTSQPVDLEQARAAAYQAIADNPNLDAMERYHAEKTVDRQIAEQAIIQGQTAKAQEEQKHKALDTIADFQMKGKPLDALNYLQSIPDSVLPPRDKFTMQKSIEKDAVDSENGKLIGGPGYHSIYSRMLLPPGTPGRINSAVDIAQAYSAGSINKRERDDLQEQMTKVTNKPSEFDEQLQIQKGFMDPAKQYFVHNLLTGNGGEIEDSDPKGANALAEATTLMLTKYRAYRQDHGSGEGFPLFDEDKRTKFFQDIQSKRELNDALMSAGQRPMEAWQTKTEQGQFAGAGQPGPEAYSGVYGDPSQLYTTEQLPPPPPTVPPEIWQPLISHPPLLPNGQVATPFAWGKVLTMLASNPTPQMFEALKKSKNWGNAGIDLDGLAKKLRGTSQRGQ